MTDPAAATEAPVKLTHAVLHMAGLTFPQSHYAIDLDWRYLEDHLTRELDVGLDLDPDYQRVHCWTEAQRVAYVEHVLTGGEVGKTLTLGIVGKTNSLPASGKFRHYSLVDGKQRLDAVRRFLRDEFQVFRGLCREEGWLWSEMDRSITRALVTNFRWQVVLVSTRAELLRLYLKINRGGTQHTDDEIAKVEALLQKSGAV